MPRTKIFISYSREDEALAEEIVLRLKSKAPEDNVFWDKRDIRPADQWQRVIEREVPLTQVAIFLISPTFLASNFIEKELRLLLAAKKKDPSVAVFWVLLKAAQVPRQLREYQGFCYGTPLTALSEAEHQRALEYIAETVSKEVKQETDLREEFTGRVRRLVRKNFDLRLDAQVNEGDHSIIYRASGDDGEYAVKARVARVFERHFDTDGDELQKRLEICKGLSEKNPVFIPVKGGLVNGDLQILISNYIRNRRSLRDILLEKYRAENTGLEPDIARFIVGQLACALADYHDCVKRPFGVIRPSDVLVDETDWQVQINSFRMSIVEFEQSKDTDKIMLTNDVLSYLAPEQHHKLELTKKSDQYALGILAIELLEGSPPVKVRSIGDLSRVQDFYDNTYSPRPAWEKLSEQSREVLMKMISKNQRQRYRSMREIVAQMGVLAELSEDNRRVAKKSYEQFANIRRDLIKPFYKTFFEDEDIEAMFKENEKFNKKKQYKKLEQALLFLLNFRERDQSAEPTTLTNVRKIHDEKPIKEDHFDRFEACLLRALEVAGQPSDEVRIAWSKTMQPCLSYMKERFN